MNKFIIILVGILAFFSELSYSQVYLFDKDTTGIKKITEKTGKYKSYFKYDKSGYLTEIDYGYTKYMYNYIISDSLVNVSIYSTNALLNVMYKCYFDLSGRIIRIDDINIKNNDTILNYWYDNFVYENAKIISKINHSYAPRNYFSSDTTFYKYNHFNHLCLVTNNDRIIKYIYNSNNLLTVKIHICTDPESKFYMYNHYSNFDKMGNWREMIEINFDGKIRKTKRTIEYWEPK